MRWQADPSADFDVVEFLEQVVVSVHFTDHGLPMIGVFPLGPETLALAEPWQAREIGNQLQTLAERLIRAAGVVETARALDPKSGGLRS